MENERQYTHIVHPFPPVFDSRSEILILGTLPSVKSRENDFYYGHRRNRFWRVLAELLSAEVPHTKEEKTALLLQNRLALWDVVYSCDIHASSDSSIRNVVPTDLRAILDTAPIRAIYANGAKAGELYRKYQEKEYGIPITVLPSTSPANAAWQTPKLLEAWSVIKSIREQGECSRMPDRSV